MALGLQDQRSFVESRGSDVELDDFAAELTEAAYPVALRHGLGKGWLDLELELWSAMTQTVKKWDQQYRDRGLTIIGVHTPELSEEYNLDNVRREVPSLGINYAIVTDNDYKTWKAYNLEAWPTIFVIDKQGRIRWQHAGEGRYEETESVIKELLAE